MKALSINFKEWLVYTLFGGLTTVVNVVSFVVCTHLHFGTASANTIAWVLSVIFAYVTNKIWVFKSTASGWLLMKEAAQFFGCRLLSYFIDLGIMVAFVDFMGFNGFVMKLIANVFVVIFNYIFSKLIIFRKQT